MIRTLNQTRAVGTKYPEKDVLHRDTSVEPNERAPGLTRSQGHLQGHPNRFRSAHSVGELSTVHVCPRCPDPATATGYPIGRGDAEY